MFQLVSGCSEINQNEHSHNVCKIIKWNVPYFRINSPKNVFKTLSQHLKNYKTLMLYILLAGNPPIK